jgi:hypothetical protein
VRDNSPPVSILARFADVVMHQVSLRNPLRMICSREVRLHRRRCLSPSAAMAAEGRVEEARLPEGLGVFRVLWGVCRDPASPEGLERNVPREAVDGGAMNEDSWLWCTDVAAQEGVRSPTVGCDRSRQRSARPSRHAGVWGDPGLDSAPSGYARADRTGERRRLLLSQAGQGEGENTPHAAHWKASPV